MTLPEPFPRVLVVEDDAAIRGLLAATFRREQLLVDDAPDGLAALDRLRENDYTTIVLDLMMPGMNGFDFLTAYRNVTRQRPVILVVTAFDDRGLAKYEHSLQQAHAILRKPLDVHHLAQLVREIAYIRHPASSTLAALREPARVIAQPDSRVQLS